MTQENFVPQLKSLEDIKQHFAQNDVPYFFISTSNFNVMGMHEWVRGWRNINLLDCFDGQHPQVLVVPDDYSQIFSSIEDINAYLLSSDAARQLFESSASSKGKKSKALFLFFDPKLEASCAALDLAIALPSHAKVREIDSKIVTTEIGNQAGVYSVPNLLTKVSSYAQLRALASGAGLGSRWVVQTAYGDSGKTTFFIESEADYQAVAAKIEAEESVKVMRWINCTGTAIEACATRWGTFVGPLLTELIGLDSLTPYAGGWCGNELYDAAFSPDIRSQVQRKTEAMGNALYQRGYRGYFELDYLIDQESGEVYLGELNARITGISAMTNLSDFSAKTVPLFLFHLLEYDHTVELDVDVPALNDAMRLHGAQGVSAQVVLKQTEPMLQIVTEAPVSGVYVMNDAGALVLKCAGYDRRAARAANEAYILRIMAKDEYAYEGGDLAIMFVNCVIRTSTGSLSTEGERWVRALKQCFGFRPLTQEERGAVERTHNPAHMKSERVA